MTEGLIPAHAGNTQIEVSEQETIGAHPRSRGEHYDQDEAPAMTAGSSPLTRGTLLLRRR